MDQIVGAAGSYLSRHDSLCLNGIEASQIPADLTDYIGFCNDADHLSVRIANDQQGFVRFAEKLSCICKRGIHLNFYQTLKR
jgi:hypothetical protein